MVPIGQVVQEMARFEGQPVVYLGHPIIAAPQRPPQGQAQGQAGAAPLSVAKGIEPEKMRQRLEMADRAGDRVVKIMQALRGGQGAGAAGAAAQEVPLTAEQLQSLNTAYAEINLVMGASLCRALQVRVGQCGQLDPPLCAGMCTCMPSAACRAMQPLQV